MLVEPKILAFACHWCSYAAADLAGISRLQYPANIRIIRVMCSGMVHPNLVAEAFQRGADGVLVMGCHPGECHYVEGNLKALARTELVLEMLDAMDLEPERFRLLWCSAVEAERFVAAVTEMTENLRKFGSTPYRTGSASGLPEPTAKEVRSCP